MLDKLIKLLKLDITIPQSNCWNCGGPIFNLNSQFGKMGLCVYCYSAYEQGQDFVLNKHPYQTIVTCMNCHHKLTIRNRIINLFFINKVALCCKHPDYSYR